MIIGVLKEIKDNENRVALTPSGADTLVRQGHRVLIQDGAGVNTGFRDDEYREAGAAMLAGPGDIAGQADILVKVKEPLPEEYPLFEMLRGKALFTFLHLAGSERELTERLLEHRITAIGYETVEDSSGALPILRPMSQIAGVFAVQSGAEYLHNKYGGAGKTLGAIDGAPSALVTVAGGGTAGSSAAKTAAGMGAQVTLFEISDNRIEALEQEFSHVRNISIRKSEPDALMAALKRTDLLIGAVLVSGKRAPVVVKEEMVKGMKHGTVIIDIAIDQGGCIALSHPTSHSDPIFRVDGKIFCCIPNLPGQVACQSTQALTAASFPYLLAMAGKGIMSTLSDDCHFARGLNTHDGFIANHAVAESLGMTERYRAFP